MDTITQSPAAIRQAVVSDLYETLPDLDSFAKVEVVGAWLWITFGAKPNEGIRAELKRMGFKFSAKRSGWYHACGKRAGGRLPKEKDPRDTYGAERLYKVLHAAKAEK